MKFSTREDIEAPLDNVFAALSDFETWERAAMRRGAEVIRTDRMAAPGPGMGWHVEFIYRGKLRKMDIALAEMLPGQRLILDGKAAPADGRLEFDLVEMGPRRTRITVGFEVKPRSLAARLFLQSLKLAKSRVNRRFDLRVARMAADIEDRYRASLRG
ncbi:SRPBCC family protein [Szabonella alba]|uniref:SRPBCC family protein n=1 Tax=Szabonella alba TaxID=2804194 RepID=A0A8K0XYD4_9RHOB|nr:SRPBCC family protein [Szabonella alba]MBL4915616.1 SRPBCC family protein [Szabonella alba]